MSGQSHSYSLDFVRALAIILILLAHLPEYEILLPGQLSLYCGYLGVGLFLFISGYLLALHNTSFQSAQDIVTFYKKRAYRIYPLYVTALLAFFVVYGVLFSLLGYTSGMDFGLQNMIIHILDLQVVLSPAYAQPLLTLYYVGLIGIFYGIFPFLMKYSPSLRTFLINAMLLFFLFAGLRVFFTIIDDYFFIYYFTFIAGILFCAISRETYDKKWLKYVLVIPFILVFALMMEISGGFTYPGFHLNIPNMLNFAYFNLAIISFCVIQVAVAMLYFDEFSGRIKEFVKALSFSSFAVFLFHRPILTLFDGIAALWGISQLAEDVLILFIAIPFVFLFSYYIQVLEEKMKNAIAVSANS